MIDDVVLENVLVGGVTVRRVKTGTDNGPALRAMIAQAETGRWGRKVELPPGRFLVEGDIVLRRGVSLVGAGRGSSYGDGTELRVHGSVILDQVALEDGDAVRSDGALLADVRIVPARPRADETVRPGIVMRSPSSLVRVNVFDSDGPGVEIVDLPGHKAYPDGWRLDDVIVDSANGHGVLVHGPDTNAGLGTAVRVRNCTGWGIVDHSALGCTWVGCEAQTNRLGSYRSIQRTGFSTWVGCYAEMNQAPAVLVRPSVAIGGAIGNGVRGYPGNTAELAGRAARLPMTQYELGDVVTVAGWVDVVARAARAGKTTGGSLNPRTPSDGDVIEDGGVLWEAHATFAVAPGTYLLGFGRHERYGTLSPTLVPSAGGVTTYLGDPYEQVPFRMSHPDDPAGIGFSRVPVLTRAGWRNAWALGGGGGRSDVTFTIADAGASDPAGSLSIPRGFFVGAGEERVRCTTGLRPPEDGELGDEHRVARPQPGEPCLFRCTRSARRDPRGTVSTPARWTVAARLDP